MLQLGSSQIDFSALWTFTLLLCRFSGVFLALPGIGTNTIPNQFRFVAVMSISTSLTLSGLKAEETHSILEAIVMLSAEFGLGYVMAMIPTFVLGGLSVAGQVISGSIGLGQANMMDPSLGGSVSVIAMIQTWIATIVFLLIDGHHVVIRAAAGTPGHFAAGLFRPTPQVAEILLSRLVSAFELAAIVSAPVLVSALVTQFVLGLITKFVPQVNIFIISLPLSLLVGLYIMEHTYPGMVELVTVHFSEVEEVLGRLCPECILDGAH